MFLAIVDRSYEIVRSRLLRNESEQDPLTADLVKFWGACKNKICCKKTNKIHPGDDEDDEGKEGGGGNGEEGGLELTNTAKDGEGSDDDGEGGDDDLPLSLHHRNMENVYGEIAAHLQQLKDDHRSTLEFNLYPPPFYNLDWCVGH